MHLEQLVRYIPALGGVGLLVALTMYMYLKRQPVGTPRMREISGLIETGAMAFLRREYIVLTPVIVIVALLLAWKVGVGIGLAFVFGGVCSVLAGFMGMKSATKCNVRTTEAARTHGQARALEIAFDGGAVMGLAVASLGLLGLADAQFFQYVGCLRAQLLRRQADLGRLDVDRVTAQADDRHLGRVARPGGRLLEEQGHAVALEVRQHPERVVGRRDVVVIGARAQEVARAMLGGAALPG